MASEPLISFCIPTYNQPDKVAALLHDLERELTDNVEVLVRDDSPNNHTQEEVEKSPLRGRIRYFHGKKEGYDAAAIFLIEEAKGKYVWIFGDDVLRLGAMRKVQDALLAHTDISFLFLNSANVDQPDKPPLTFGKNFYFKNRDEVLTSLGDLLGFPSGAVFLRSAAIKNVHLLRRHMGLSLMSLSLALHVLAEPGSYYFLSEPLVLTEPKRPDDKLWYDVFEVYALNVHRILNDFRGKFGDKAIRAADRANFASIWRSILVQRSKGITTNFGSPQVKIYPLFVRYWTFPEFWLALPFFFVPRAILRRAYPFYKKLHPGTMRRLPERIK